MLTQLDVWKSRKESAVDKNDVCFLPKQLDEQVATLHFPVLGAMLTVFAEEQADCIACQGRRPFQAYKNEVHLLEKQLASDIAPSCIPNSSMSK